MEKVICIGFGSSGRRYLKNLSNLGDFEIFVARRNVKDKINPCLQNYENYKFINYDDISKFSPYKYAFITTPSAIHFKNIKFLDNYTNGSVIVEKPLITDKNNVEELIKIIKKRNNKFFIGYQYRFHKLILFLKKIIINNEYGSIIDGEFNHCEDVKLWHPWEDYKNSYSVNEGLGGGVKNTLSHDIDSAIFLFGAPKKSLSFKGKSNIDLSTDSNDWHKCLLLYEDDNLNKPIQINSSYNSKISLHNFTLNFQKVSILGDFNTGLIKIYKKGGELIKSEKYYSSKDDCYSSVINEMINNSATNKRVDYTNLIDEKYIKLICEILLN